MNIGFRVLACIKTDRLAVISFRIKDRRGESTCFKTSLGISWKEVEINSRGRSFTGPHLDVHHISKMIPLHKSLGQPHGSDTLSNLRASAEDLHCLSCSCSHPKAPASLAASPWLLICFSLSFQLSSTLHPQCFSLFCDIHPFIHPLVHSTSTIKCWQISVVGAENMVMSRKNKKKKIPASWKQWR